MHQYIRISRDHIEVRCFHLSFMKNEWLIFTYVLSTSGIFWKIDDLISEPSWPLQHDPPRLFFKICANLLACFMQKIATYIKKMPDQTPYYQATSRSVTMSIAIIRSTIANCTVDPAATYWDHKLHLLQKKVGYMNLPAIFLKKLQFVKYNYAMVGNSKR